MKKDIKKLISQMTLEEKANLCSGGGKFCTTAIERLGIPAIMMADGPHGLRKEAQSDSFIGAKSIPATCFPTAAALACSWDRNLVEKVGMAIAEECQAEGVSILLGPGVNIKRSPLCGRNFEYYSEDPYLSSELAASFITGVQSKGVGTSIKHFAANNQEHRRMTVNAVIDERTLREIYLASFEGAIKKAKPWTVMCAYNKVNGEYCSQNKYLLTDILRNEWGFEGVVISDWGAVDERVEALVAGLDLEMPSSYGVGARKIIEAVKSGKIQESVLDQAVERILNIVFKAVENKKENVSYDKEAHHLLAKEVAKECIVLLKNEDNILPLKKESKIAVIGAFAKNPRYQGGGSSRVNPTKVDIPYDEILKIVENENNVFYAEGYRLEADEIDWELIEKAKEIAIRADVAVIFAGLPEKYESEWYDREHMRMPESHNKLIEAISEVQKNVVVVLSNGAPIEMPWIDKVKGVFEAYLAGQAFGGAIAELLFGIGNPCGKLAESFPKKLSHNPSYLNFPGEGDMVEYREGIFVGYRYYDKKGIEVLFPFGHGLSYTTFEYTGISVDKKEITDNDVVNVTVKIKNVGNLTGKEIVQLYVRDVESSVIRPEKELKAFEKVELKPGEEKSITFVLDKRAFAYFNVDIKDWYVEEGEFEILIGKSSRDIVLKESIYVKSTKKLRKTFTRNSTIGDIMQDSRGKQVVEKIIKEMKKSGVISTSSQVDPNKITAFMKYTPLRALVPFSKAQISEEMIEEILEELNQDSEGKPI